MHNIGMPSVRPSFSSLRFAPAFRAGPVGPGRAALASEASAGAPIAILDVPRQEGLDLLDWLGLGRPDFGAIPARSLAPLCRRRLWDVARNANPALRARAGQPLHVAEAAGEGMVLFG